MNKPQAPKPEHPEYIRGQRETAEQMARSLRGYLAAWKREETSGRTVLEKARVALFWAINTRWAARIEGVIASLEQGAVTLKNQEAASKPRRFLFFR